jgi:hypothetical protein
MVVVSADPSFATRDSRCRTPKLHWEDNRRSQISLAIRSLQPTTFFGAPVGSFLSLFSDCHWNTASGCCAILRLILQ